MPHTEENLSELVSHYGEIFSCALRKTDDIANRIEDNHNWIIIADEIGLQRAKELDEGLAHPTREEVRKIIRAQVAAAFKNEDYDKTPLLYTCRDTKSGNIFVIEGWGGVSRPDVNFTLFGIYSSQEIAEKSIRENYIFSVDDLE